MGSATWHGAACRSSGWLADKTCKRSHRFRFQCSVRFEFRCKSRFRWMMCVCRETQLREKAERSEQERGKQLALDAAMEAERVASIRSYEVSIMQMVPGTS